MLGFTNNEAILWDVLLLLTNQELQDIPPERAVLYSFNITDENIKIEIANKIRNFYYGGNHSSFDNLGRYKLGGDAYVYWEALKSAKYHAKIEDQNVYLYMFSADTELNYFKRLHPMTAKIEGASHIDDLGYIFKTIHTPDIKPRSPEWNAMERVVKLWTNFAKYGNPTPKRKEFNVPWKLVRGRGRNYMDIGTDSLNMRANPFRRRMAFWDMLEEEYVTRRENKGYVS